MTDEAEIHANKRTDKTYVSPRIPTICGALRIASKVIDSEGMHFATVKDEVLLRRTPSGRTEIIAKFLEDDRNVTVLTLQSFNGNSGLLHQTHFSFVGSEVPKLLEFFRSIASVDIPRRFGRHCLQRKATCVLRTNVKIRRGADRNHICIATGCYVAIN